MRKFFVVMMAAFLSFAAYAQDFREATAEESEAILAKVELSPSEIGSLKCDFTQTKHTALLDEDLVSKGHVAIDAPKTIVWEVTSPYQKMSKVDISSDKRMQAMARKNDFAKKVYVSGKEYKVVLTPLKRDLKQLFKTIEVTFLQSTGDAEKVVMTDAAGDTTTIEFRNVKR